MSQSPSIPLMLLPHGKGLPLPRYQSPAAAGADLYAAIDAAITLAPLARASTGFSGTTQGLEAQLRPVQAGRSARDLLNSPGTIDADYRGEIQVLLINLGEAAVTMGQGARIAQLVITPVCQARFDPCDKLVFADAAQLAPARRTLRRLGAPPALHKRQNKHTDRQTPSAI